MSGETMNEILLSVHLEELPEGGFLATSDELPGLVAQGRTLAETLEIAQDVARKLVESYREHGDELPLALKAAPSSTDLHIPVSIA
jgi:predicted RNase H-like HicB family nuclease